MVGVGCERKRRPAGSIDFVSWMEQMEGWNCQWLGWGNQGSGEKLEQSGLVLSRSTRPA